MSIRIFISHSSADKAVVRRLANDLKENNVHVWLDEWEIRVGDRIAHKIQEGLAAADYLAVWLTPQSVDSGWVEREWQTRFHDEASTNRVIVLPLLGEQCELPPLLRDKKYADFSQDYGLGFSELLQVLNASPHRNAEIPFDTRDASVRRFADDCTAALQNQISRSHLQDFVEPAYAQFEKVHESYLEAFQRYRILLSTEEPPLDPDHPIFDAINEDHVFSSGTREKLAAARKAIQQNEKSVRIIPDGDDLLMLPEMDPLNEMAWLMNRYVSGAESGIFYDDLKYISNFPRSSLYSGLKFLASASKEKLRELKFSSGQNCFDFVMHVSGNESSSPPMLMLEGGGEWDFVLKIGSKPEWDSLQRALERAWRNYDGVRKALAIALVDKIVRRNQEMYGRVSSDYQEIRSSTLQ